MAVLSLVQQGRKLFRPLDVAFLSALGAPYQQHDHLPTALGKVHTPASADVDAQLEDALAHRFDVTHQATLEPLGARNHRTAHRYVFEASEPILEGDSDLTEYKWIV
jgi:hypothetical protein